MEFFISSIKNQYASMFRFTPRSANDPTIPKDLQHLKFYGSSRAETSFNVHNVTSVQ